MSDLALFAMGVVVSIPAGVCIVGLVLAAIRDGRDDDQL